MESQKIKNLLDLKDETYPKYQTKTWYVINDRNNDSYDDGDQNDKIIKIDTEVVKPFLWDYADGYILVTGNVTVEGGNANTKAPFKNCHPFTKSTIHLNDESVEDSDNLDIIMNMYNLNEYFDNYEDSTASLYHYKKQEQNYAGNGNVNNITANASTSFEYKSKFLGNATEKDGNAVLKNVQIVVPLKYVSSFFRSLEMPLINTKIYIQLNYTKHSVISDNAGTSTFKITKTELHVPVVTLKTEGNNKLNKLLIDSESGDSTTTPKSKGNKLKELFTGMNIKVK